MKTYFVTGKVDQDGNPIVCPFQKIMEEHRLKNGDAVDEFIVQEDKHAGFQALDQPVKVDRPPPPPAASKNTLYLTLIEVHKFYWTKKNNRQARAEKRAKKGAKARTKERAKARTKKRNKARTR